MSPWWQKLSGAWELLHSEIWDTGTTWLELEFQLHLKFFLLHIHVSSALSSAHSSRAPRTSEPTSRIRLQTLYISYIHLFRASFCLLDYHWITLSFPPYPDFTTNQLHIERFLLNILNSLARALLNTASYKSQLSVPFILFYFPFPFVLDHFILFPCFFFLYVFVWLKCKSNLTAAWINKTLPLFSTSVENSSVKETNKENGTFMLLQQSFPALSM